MKSGRLVWIGLLAFVGIASLLVLVSVTPLTPFKSESTQIVSPTPRDSNVARPATPVPGGTSRSIIVTSPTRAALEEATLAPPTELPTDAPGLPPPTLPANSSDAFQQGIIMRRNGDYERAATAFRTALQENPDPALAREAQFRLGEASYLAADFTNAVPALEAVILQSDADSLAARAHYFLGDILTQQQKYDSALQHLRAYRQRTRALMGEIDREIGDVLLAS